jgi:hypothetical protein
MPVHNQVSTLPYISRYRCSLQHLSTAPRRMVWNICQDIQVACDHAWGERTVDVCLITRGRALSNSITSWPHLRPTLSRCHGAQASRVQTQIHLSALGPGRKYENKLRVHFILYYIITISPAITRTWVK